MVKLTKKEQRKVLEIAKRVVYGVKERGDLETRHSDGEDFLDIAVWTLREAMEEAYALGKEDGRNEKG